MGSVKNKDNIYCNMDCTNNGTGNNCDTSYGNRDNSVSIVHLSLLIEGGYQKSKYRILPV